MKRHRLQLFAWATLLLGWVGYALAGGWVSHLVAARFGGVLLRVGQGKFSDAPVFVQGRLRELLWLATLALLWVVAHRALDRLYWLRGGQGRWRWVAHGVAGFVLLNVWIGFAANTALFWGVLGAGGGVQNYMQFQFKRVMAGEVRAPMRAVLVGSSQTRAQIDEGLLNERLGTNLWTTELHFPGSKASDLLLIEPQLARARAQFVVCYFTEGYLYTGSHGEVPPNFLGFGQLPDAWRRGALKHLSSSEVGYGLLGDALPLFRCREVVSQRLLGAPAAQLKQAQYDAALAVDLDARARDSARSFRMDAETDFQKRAFEDFVIRCEQAERKVVLLTGGYNPVLTRQMNPSLRVDMIKFLDGIALRHANVVLVESTLPVQTAADYDDLNHVNVPMQQRFTGWLATLMDGLMVERAAHSDVAPR